MRAVQVSQHAQTPNKNNLMKDMRLLWGTLTHVLIIVALAHILIIILLVFTLIDTY
jgi:hypothetical protein